MSSFDDDDDLRDFRDLPRESEPPAELEERVVAALRERNLIEPASRPAVSRPEVSRPAAGSGRSRWAVAAAVVLAALGGWMARAVIDATPPRGGDGKEYLVLFAEPNGLRTDKTVPELVGEYREWATDLGAKGRLVAGRRLLDAGRRISTDEVGAMAISSEGPWVEATGFFLIRAAGWDEAIELVQDSPHLAYGGEISLREVARDG